MKGFGKFLFGGLLGAVFGFLVSPTRARRVRDALLGKNGVRAVAPPPRVATPSLYAPAVPTAAFPPPVSVEAEPIAEPEIMPEPEAEAEPEPEAEPELIAEAEIMP
ncbi:MAG: hypothetical protein MUQ56_00935, partial [Thermoleophilia bacterium]|nr:hypothetical protein [Thermoleophilia bacterium]